MPPKWLYHLHSYQWRMRVPVAPHLCQHLVLSVLWIWGHSNSCIMIAHYFDLHFPDDTWQAASFHMLICHLDIFFGECLLNALAHSLIGLFVFLLTFKSSLNILDSSLSSECLCKYFLLVYSLCSQSLNMVFHRAVSILMISNLSIIHFMDNAIDIDNMHTQGYFIFFSSVIFRTFILHLHITSITVHLGLWPILSYFLWRL